MLKRSYEMDMCSGPLLGKILLFAFPLMLSGILQLLFNAADIIVVGQFTGSQAMAAVGATSSLINLIVNLFIGLSIGTNVLVARYYGAGDRRDVSESVHTSILVAGVCGVGMVFLGILLAEPLLILTGAPEDVIDQSVLYMRIYFVGMPAFMLYNFGAAVLRAIGDTRRPLYFLLIAGAINVIFNLIFVIVFHMGVAGVAIATVMSQCVSAALILYSLCHTPGACHLRFRLLRFYPDKFLAMLRIGLPAGLQGVIFNISNVLIQSTVNSFGSLTVAGNTAASNIEGFVYTSMNSVYQTSLSFTSQNMGARQYKRVGQILRRCLLVVTVIGVVMGDGAFLIGRQLLGIYTSDPEVVSLGMERLSVICSTYFLCGVMDTFVGSLRGMGYSIMPMLVSLTGACLMRIIWIFTIFQMEPTLFMLYISYPISWALTAAAHFVCYLAVRKRAFRAQEARAAQRSAG